MKPKAIQDQYPAETSHCYGCGTQNDHGLHIKSYWDGEQATAQFTPAPYHIAVPGFVYGGLLASLVDCHGTGTAAGASAEDDSESRDQSPPRFVTASLHVDFLKPTPHGVPLTLIGTVLEKKKRKVIVQVEIKAQGVTTVKGQVVTARMPETMNPLHK